MANSATPHTCEPQVARMKHTSSRPKCFDQAHTLLQVYNLGKVGPGYKILIVVCTLRRNSFI